MRRQLGVILGSKAGFREVYKSLFGKGKAYEMVVSALATKKAGMIGVHVEAYSWRHIANERF